MNDHPRKADQSAPPTPAAQCAPEVSSQEPPANEQGAATAPLLPPLRPFAGPVQALIDADDLEDARRTAVLHLAAAGWGPAQ